MLGFSAAYNLWPVSRRKWLLRRFDHSAIYVLIAATYTPVFAQLQDRVFAMSLLAGVWGVAVVGIAVKLMFPGRFDRLAVGLYLAMGWSGIIAYDAGLSQLPKLAFWLILAGGLLSQFRGNLSRMATAALPERDLALFRAARRGVPLHRRARSGFSLAHPFIIQGLRCR